jgi:hypothetical protein
MRLQTGTLRHGSLLRTYSRQSGCPRKRGKAKITSADVWAAYAPAKEAADRLGTGVEFRARVRSIIASYTRGEAFVGHVLRGQLGDA